MSVEDRLVWIDTETFGLNPQTDYLLEVGFKITDLQLKPIDQFEVKIWQIGPYDVRYSQCCTDPADKYVLDMHRKSKLFSDAQFEGVSILRAEFEMNAWLAGHGIEGEDPMCGSSVQFDRLMLEAQFPSVFSRFHYRNIDVSTCKELCKRYAPQVYEKKPETRDPVHRVMPDLEDTIDEFEYYRDSFFWSMV